MDGGEESGPKVRVKAVDREQMVMRAIDVERLIDEDHPARSIWEFVGRQDLSGFYREIRAMEGGLGRSPWDPRMMITLWVYAYSEGVSSAREIERLRIPSCLSMDHGYGGSEPPQPVGFSSREWRSA